MTSASGDAGGLALGHFTKDDLLQQAALVDPGFDQQIFAQMLRSLPRFSDQDLPIPETRIPALRDFVATWAKELEAIPFN